MRRSPPFSYSGFHCLCKLVSNIGKGFCCCFVREWGFKQGSDKGPGASVAAVNEMKPQSCRSQDDTKVSCLPRVSLSLYIAL